MGILILVRWHLAKLLVFKNAIETGPLVLYYTNLGLGRHCGSSCAHTQWSHNIKRINIDCKVDYHYSETSWIIIDADVNQTLSLAIPDNFLQDLAAIRVLTFPVTQGVWTWRADHLGLMQQDHVSVFDNTADPRSRPLIVPASGRQGTDVDHKHSCLHHGWNKTCTIEVLK